MDTELLALMNDDSEELERQLDWYKRYACADYLYLRHQQGCFVLSYDQPLIYDPFALALLPSMPVDTMVEKIREHLSTLMFPLEPILHIAQDESRVFLKLKVQRIFNAELQIAIMRAQGVLNPPLLDFTFIDHDTEDGTLVFIAHSEILDELCREDVIDISKLYYYYLRAITSNQVDIDRLGDFVAEEVHRLHDSRLIKKKIRLAREVIDKLLF